MTKRLYTAPELMRLTRMTRRQVDYWEQRRLLVPLLRDAQAPAGRPARFYSANEVLKALIICDLRRAGFTPRQVHEVARNLERHGLRLETAEPYLLSDGYSVYFARTDSEVIDILKHHRQMMLLISIHDWTTRLRQVA